MLLSLIATVWLTPQILAAPLESYCISKVAQKQEPNSPTFKAPHPFKKKQTRLNIPVQDKKSFSVVVSGVDNLLLMDGNDPKPLAKVEATQVYRRLGVVQRRLAVDRLRPTLTQPVAVPELYEKPCSFWHRFWLECKRVQGFYSSVLERAFITGHCPTLFGWADLVSLEMVAGEVKPLPAKAQGVSLYSQVPKLQGVLFEGPSKELFFYNGVTFTTLLPGYPEAPQNSQIPFFQLANWNRVYRTRDGRFFLMNFSLSKSLPWLMELKSGQTLRPIAISQELAKGNLSLYTFPKDSRLWGLKRHSLVTEVEGSLRTVVTIPEPFRISGTKSQAPDGTISFIVGNGKTGTETNYFLRRVLSTHKCRIVLNSNEPIFLGN